MSYKGFDSTVLEIVVSNKNVMMLFLKLIGSIRIRITSAIYNLVDQPILLQYVNRNELIMNYN